MVAAPAPPAAPGLSGPNGKNVLFVLKHLTAATVVFTYYNLSSFVRVLRSPSRADVGFDRFYYAARIKLVAPLRAVYLHRYRCLHDIPPSRHVSRLLLIFLSL